MPVRGLVRAVVSGVIIVAVVAVAACSGGGGSDGPTNPGVTTGSMTVSVSGLPSGTNAAIAVTGPGGYSSNVTSTTTLSSLAPGTYTLTPGRVKDVGLDYASDPSTVSVTAGGTGAGSVTYALRTLVRSTTNRTDETSALKFHIMYLLPSDGTDRSLDTNGTITKEISSWERWLAGQTNGKYLRLDLSDGGIDIQFAKLGRTDATYTSYGTFARDSIEVDLKRASLVPATGLIIAYYEGGNSTACASAAVPPGLPGPLGVVFLKGLASSSFPCANNPFATSPTAAPGYLQFVALHETLHLLGIVSAAAPNYTASHVGNSPTDLMYAGNQQWAPSVLDFSKTNYYNAAGLPAGVTNLNNSVYLVVP